MRAGDPRHRLLDRKKESNWVSLIFSYWVKDKQYSLVLYDVVAVVSDGYKYHTYFQD